MSALALAFLPETRLLKQCQISGSTNPLPWVRDRVVRMQNHFTKKAIVFGSNLTKQKTLQWVERKIKILPVFFELTINVS
jgi:hypothetical protein